MLVVVVVDGIELTYCNVVFKSMDSRSEQSENSISSRSVVMVDVVVDVVACVVV